MLREILDEFAALGWHAIAYGPEAHLVLPLLYALLGAILLAFWRKK